MALTKVTGQVIKNTTDVTVGVLTVTNTLAVGGTVSIGGTLTYEDVTNVDAVGLITARNGIVVGSGITLSKDGDGFFTGVITATSYSGIDLSDVTGATGDFSIADKIVHTGDTNTALRFPAADTVTAETGGSERIRIDSSGRALLGPGAVATPKASTSGLDVSSGLYSIIMGGETNVGTGDGRRDGYQKESRLGMPHFTVAEEPVGLIYGVTLSGENRLYFGGGSSILNAATSIAFHTAPSATTTAGTERLKVEAAGNVNFASNVNVSGTSTVSGIAQFANTINLTHASAGQNYIYFNEDLQLAKNGTGTRLKIDSSGRVLIGLTASQTTDSNAHSKLQVASSAGPNIGLGNNSSDIDDDDRLGVVNFSSNHGGSYHEVVTIRAAADADHASNSKASRLELYTTSTGATQATERLRITSAGKIGINQSTPDVMLHLAGDPASNGAIVRLENTTAMGQDELVGAVEFEKQDGSGAGAGLCGGMRCYSEDSYGARTYLAFSVRSNSTGAAATDTEIIRLTRHGIIFDSSVTGTDASKALDDYEEGSSVITVYNNSNLTLHSGYSTCDYTKVGNIVTLTMLLIVTSVSGSDYFFVNLPFSNRNESNPRRTDAIGVCMHNGINTGDAGMVAYLPGNTNVLRFYKVNDNSGWSIIDNGDLAVDDELYVTITYKTAT